MTKYVQQIFLVNATYDHKTIFLDTANKGTKYYPQSFSDFIEHAKSINNFIKTRSAIIIYLLIYLFIFTYTLHIYIIHIFTYIFIYLHIYIFIYCALVLLLIFQVEEKPPKRTAISHFKFFCNSKMTKSVVGSISQMYIKSNFTNRKQDFKQEFKKESRQQK